MKKASLLLFLVAALSLGTFTSCHKTVDKNATEFIGNWWGSSATNTYQILVYDDGTATYNVFPLASLTATETITGKARYYDNTLQIDKEKFTVAQVPTQTGLIWTMQIESIVYTKSN